MRNRRPILRWPLATFLGVFLIGSCCPLWTVWESAIWKVGGWEAVGHEADLWESVGNVPYCLRQSPDTARFWRLQYGNLLNTTVLVFIAVGAGLLAHWIGTGRSEQSDAEDYKEAPGGAIPDGRIKPTTPSNAGPPSA